jgi:hypothetical protein
MAELKGSCLCGSVTYSCSAEPVMTALCHCTECQKQTGSSFSIVAAVPAFAFSVQGESLATFTTVGDDHGQEVQRKFCGNCGSPIVSVIAAAPDLVYVKAGTLDDTASVEPKMEVWCRSAQPWVGVDEGRQRFERGPGS